mmetsp:Transcript_8307/g.12349  ORF Transcript_8307/g.12349 Transcript_8307/m.12349 type:complete len:230 (-) Transcript_8307:65-754(-)|eukprot:CAMPEP_0116026676 /NCGR_PEP_ID=MMETSP0321-20121206/14038_1 /TAXON_ID=163516 /ORGANISM="Leptocylindrus danicus var. danicus, Strain B650" /LENGTH=229 /DNA_ID=CAMNT_0003499611 /DNA_START=44 /DNA_END=733 /DNA_ORIENTATION=-
MPELPRCNREYAKKSYWEERFATEESFEWLASYKDVAPQLKKYLPACQSDPILVVGCGNSSFSYELYSEGGYSNITSIDYSENVIAAMKEKYPDMEWVCADMTDLNESVFPTNSFACVIDKAAMDALMSDEEDVWCPAQKVVDSCRKMCAGISRILQSGGYHVHISFAQPHFRKKYLLGQHPASNNAPAQKFNENDDVCEFRWDLNHENIGGEHSVGCFHHFMYVMKKN